MQASMPGMMDTVLNLGLNDSAVEGLAAMYGERFALDCYRRLLQMFGDVVLGIAHHDFEQEIVAVKQVRGDGLVAPPSGRESAALPAACWMDGQSS
jgi:phosphoenolpyruvate synthase/pyruvate phosphate dikinase